MTDSLMKALVQIWEYQARRPAIVCTGTQALNRLIPIALSRTVEGKAVGNFLLGLYDGSEYRFDLTQLYHLDLRALGDCMSVLQMDYLPEVEIHERIADGKSIWHQLLDQWGPLPPQDDCADVHNLRTSAASKQQRQAIETAGSLAFERLLQIAESGTGQSRTVGIFLMGLINGGNYRINLTDLRGLDLAVFEDCISVLRMDYLTETEELHHPLIVAILRTGVIEQEPKAVKP